MNMHFLVDAEGKAIEGEFSDVEKTRQKPRMVKTPLCVRFERPAGWLSEKQIDALKQSEVRMAMQDFQTQEARRLRNEILSMCFKFREALTNPSKNNLFYSI